MGDAPNLSRICTRCNRVTTAREGRAPKYCAVCGQQFSQPTEARYGSQGPGFAPPAATAALILGMCSFVPVVGIVCAAVAIFLASKANRQIRASNGRLVGRGVAAAGAGLGIAGGLLWIGFCAGCPFV